MCMFYVTIFIYTFNNKVFQTAELEEFAAMGTNPRPMSLFNLNPQTKPVVLKTANDGEENNITSPCSTNTIRAKPSIRIIIPQPIVFDPFTMAYRIVWLKG